MKITSQNGKIKLKITQEVEKEAQMNNFFKQFFKAFLRLFVTFEIKHIFLTRIQSCDFVIHN